MLQLKIVILNCNDISKCSCFFLYFWSNICSLVEQKDAIFNTIKISSIFWTVVYLFIYQTIFLKLFGSLKTLNSLFKMFFFFLCFILLLSLDLNVVLPNFLFPPCSPSQCSIVGTQGDGLLSYWGPEHSLLCLFLLDGALQGNQEGISLIQWACCISQHIVPLNRVNSHTLYSNAPSIPLCPSTTQLKHHEEENKPVSDCSVVFSKWTGVLVTFDLYSCPLCFFRILNGNQHLKKMQTLRKNILFGTSGKF